MSEKPDVPENYVFESLRMLEAAQSATAEDALIHSLHALTLAVLAVGEQVNFLTEGR